jgi:hypothetical protein
MPGTSKPFGAILHRKLSMARVAIPPGVDPTITQDGADKNFLKDEVKMILGMECSRKAHMTLGTTRQQASCTRLLL